MRDFSIKKCEILRHKKTIEELFEQRKGFIQYPLRCVYRYEFGDDNQVEAKALFVVSKRYHKRAVRRNLVRRRIKEAYRLNRQEFNDKLKTLNVKNIDIAMLYVGKQEHSYKEIEDSIIRIFNNVIAYIEKNIDSNSGSTH